MTLAGRGEEGLGFAFDSGKPEVLGEDDIGVAAPERFDDTDGLLPRIVKVDDDALLGIVFGGGIFPFPFSGSTTSTFFSGAEVGGVDAGKSGSTEKSITSSSRPSPLVLPVAVPSDCMDPSATRF